MSEPARRTPRGPEQVRQALLDAAIALYAEQSPAAVSVRDVARRAGVNHGLVHRYFGSKDGLVRQAMASLTQRIAEEVERAQDAGGPMAAFQATARRGYWRVLARALLDGVAPKTLQTDFPVMKQLLQQAREAQRLGMLDDRIDPRLVVAMAAAGGLGWLLFEPFLLAATGLEEDGPEKARRDMMQLVMRWLAMRSDTKPKAEASKADARDKSEGKAKR